MAYPPPLRRVPHRGPDDYDMYDPFDDPYRGPPPRRHKSERRRHGPMPPDFGPEPEYVPRRGHGGRRGPEPYHDRRDLPIRRARSPQPSNAFWGEPPRRERHRRERPPSLSPPPPWANRYSMPPPPRHRNEEPDPRGHPSPDSRNRGRQGHPPSHKDSGSERRSRRERPLSANAQPRRHERDIPPYAPAPPPPQKWRGGYDEDGDSDGGRRRRRARSQGHSRGHPRGDPWEQQPRERRRQEPREHGGEQQQERRKDQGRDQSRGRSRGPPPAAGAKNGAPRRQSVPANIMKKGAEWWANPLVKAGARTAFSAGAQAAMQSRHDPSPWLGAKGAKVATAALGAALVDGFMAEKHPGTMRQDALRKGVDVMVGEATRRSTREKPPISLSRSNGKHRHDQ